MNKTLTFILLLVTSTLIKAQEESIITDLSTITIGAHTMPKSGFQLESGFQYQIRDASLTGNLAPDLKLEELLYNQLLLRYGITDNLEIRINNSISQTRFKLNGVTTLEDDVYFGPTTIGVKWSLVKNKSFWPNMSLLLNYGGSIFSKIDQGSIAQINLLFKSSLFKVLDLDYNVGLLLENDLKLSTITFSAVISKQFNNKLGAFFEFYASRKQEAYPLFNVDAGMTYLINDTLQLNYYIGTGFSELSPDVIFGFGISKLFLKN